MNVYSLPCPNYLTIDFYVEDNGLGETWIWREMDPGGIHFNCCGKWMFLPINKREISTQSQGCLKGCAKQVLGSYLVI